MTKNHATAREAARETDGRFGKQLHSVPDIQFDDIHPDATLARTLTLKQRHDIAVAHGAKATAWDNSYIEDFESEYPDATPRDAAQRLFELPLPFHEEGDPAYGSREREFAALELSHRAALGASGEMTRVNNLRVGDRVNVEHLDLYGLTTVTVTSPDSSPVEDELLVEVDGGTVLSFPWGAALPLVGVDESRLEDSPLWCHNQRPHPAHSRRNSYGNFDTCTGIPNNNRIGDS